jgi:hypothetical protein
MRRRFYLKASDLQEGERRAVISSISQRAACELLQREILSSWLCLKQVKAIGQPQAQNSAVAWVERQITRTHRAGKRVAILRTVALGNLGEDRPPLRVPSPRLGVPPSHNNTLT